jgi:hypothetical protein
LCIAAVLPGEKHVVILIRLEGRVEVDQVNRFVFDVPPEDIEVFAVVESAHEGSKKVRKSDPETPVSFERRTCWLESGVQDDNPSQKNRVRET